MESNYDVVLDSKRLLFPEALDTGQTVSLETPVIPLSNAVSRRYSHPDIQNFLEPCQGGFEVAGAAYQCALKDLGDCLTDAQMKDLVSASTVQEVHAVAAQALKARQENSSKSKILQVIQVLDHYSKAMDILAQAHAEYTCLLWGSIRWFLQVSISYQNLLERFATMITDIGYCLPRFALYHRVLNTTRIAGVIADLYTIILHFLVSTIKFFQRRRLRRFISVLWSPFEVAYKGTVEKIQHLQKCVEKDANATAIVRQQMDSTDFARQLADLSLAVKHTYKSILDIKRIQTARLLIDLQILLFRGIEDEVTYQETLYDIHKRACWNDWEVWILTEDKHVPWQHTKTSHLYYVLSEQVQMNLSIKRIEAASKTEGQVPMVYIFWSQGMTRRSALISIIYQILKQRADVLLYRNSPDFYLNKLRTSSCSFELLWKTFLEILFMLPGLLCCLSLLGVGEEQDDFIQAWFKFFESWSGPPVQCIIYQSTSSRYSEFRQRVDLDNLYDIESSLDVCENLNHVVRAEASRHSILKQAHITLWDNLWRATKYFFLVVSFKEYMNAVNKAVMAVVALHTQVTSLDHAEEPDSVMEFLIRWSNTEKTRSKLRRHFTIATHCILPLLIPEAGRTHLQMKANDAIATAIHSKSPKRVNATADPTQPSEAEVSDIDWNTLAITPASRSTIWCYMKAKIDAVANESFENCQPIDLDEAHHLLGHCNSTPNNASLQMRNTVLAFIKHDLFESPRLKDHMALSGELIQNELISVIETGLELAPEAMLNGAFQESIAR